MKQKLETCPLLEDKSSQVPNKEYFILDNLKSALHFNRCHSAHSWENIICSVWRTPTYSRGAPAFEDAMRPSESRFEASQIPRVVFRCATVSGTGPTPLLLHAICLPKWKQQNSVMSAGGLRASMRVMYEAESNSATVELSRKGDLIVTLEWHSDIWQNVPLARWTLQHSSSLCTHCYWGSNISVRIPRRSAALEAGCTVTGRA